MKAWALGVLRCPSCRDAVVLAEAQYDAAGDIISGFLACGACAARYPIVNGVPRLLAPRGAAAEVPAALSDRISRNFGFEWAEYARFGWDDPHYNHQLEQRVFEHKSLMTAADLDGRLVLDAGCGNGRYSYWAAKYGARVIAVDLSDGVDVAAANLAAFPNVQVVQADIFNLPFAGRTFDAVFSIGVLMCTGNAREAFASLARVVRPGGACSIHVYGKGNVFYEAVDPVLRACTSRMSIGGLQRFTAAAFRARGVLQRLRLIKVIGKVIRLDAHPHCIFDWYGAPAASHHTYAEVRQWFAAANLEVVRTHQPPPRPWAARVVQAFTRGPQTVSIRGRATPADAA